MVLCQKRLVLVLVSLLGLCSCKEATYQFPSETYPQVAPAEEFSASDYAQATNWQWKLASTWQGPGAVSPLLSWQTTLLFLNGSDGQTFDNITKEIGTEYGREKVTAPSAGWIGHHRGVTSQGLFFIWPVVPSRLFQQEMASAMGADILKIGSAGRGATGAITSWIKRRSGLNFKPSLSIDNTIESIGLLNLDLLHTPQAPVTEEDEKTKALVQSDGVVSWIVAPTTSTLDLRRIADSKTLAPTSRRISFKHDIISTESRGVLEQLGMDFAGSKQNDLRPLAIELDGKASESTFVQVIGGIFPSDRGVSFVCIDNKTRQVLVAGRN